ncbi:MAG: hypothetical protein ABL308_06985 [Oceanicaulis sp.]
MFFASLYLLGGLVLLFIVTSLARWALAVRALKGDARDEYALRTREKPGTVKDVGEDEFVRLYVDSHQPRWALYAAGGAAAALLVSPVSLLVVPWLYDVVWRAGGAPDWGGRTGYVFMFVLFFSLCFIWASVAAIFARLAHANSPEPFHHALARARGEPIPEDTGWRPRPKWARRVRPDPRTGSETEDAADRAPND